MRKSLMKSSKDTEGIREISSVDFYDAEEHTDRKKEDKNYKKKMSLINITINTIINDKTYFANGQFRTCYSRSGTLDYFAKLLDRENYYDLPEYLYLFHSVHRA